MTVRERFRIDYVTEENFVHELDLGSLGFDSVDPAVTSPAG